MVLREAGRRPLRLATSVTALSFAVAINVVARVNGDVIDEFLTLQFHTAMREDIAVSFRRPADERVLASLANLEGVDRAELLSATPVEIRNGPREKSRVLIAHPPGRELRAPLDRYGSAVQIPEDGIALDETTARLLGVVVGDTVTIRSLEGSRRERTVNVGTVFAGLTAMEAHATIDFQRQTFGDHAVTSVMLAVEPSRVDAVIERLTEMPEVLGITQRTEAIQRFNEATGESTRVMTWVLSLFAAVIAIGVVYNDARIVLSGQARELASLRVLGFTRREVSALMLGHIALEVSLAIVPGALLGKLLALWVLSTSDPEMFQFPATIQPKSYAMAVAIVVVSAVVSALLVRRRVDSLNLVEVLKTRD
jgi:putative ABC transport system permease protein